MGYFDTPQRGEEREKMLAQYRGGLRLLRDPATGEPYSEEDIARATQEGGRDFAEVDALDLALLPVHGKASVLADQFVPSRSTTGVLRGLHSPLHEMPPLPASGATVKAEATADVGAIFVGSTTIPDPTAAFATTASTLTYQVLFTVTTPANGIAGSDPDHPLLLVCLDTGERTNIPAGSKLTWAGNQPLSAVPSFLTTEDGSGGLDDETDAELGARIDANIAHKPESGNNAHFRAWARESTTAVEDGFVYAEFKYAGSTLVVITQKRGRQSETAPKGPLARIPSAGTLAISRAYMTPPASPVVPDRSLVLVLPPVAQSVNMVLALALPRGRGLGFRDVKPWPNYDSGPAVIGAVTNQTHFRIASGVVIPSTTIAPKIMVWARTRSRWEELRVATVTAAGAGFWDVVLAATPSHTLAVNDFISPAIKGAQQLAQGVERYFDGLGPGQVVDLETDMRAPRIARFPDTVETKPDRAGSSIISVLQNALSGTITSGEVLEQSATTPTIPGDVATGPSMLVAGNFAVYPL